MGNLLDMKIFKEHKKKIVVKRDTAFMEETLKDYEKSKLTDSVIALFCSVLESCTCEEIVDRMKVLEKITSTLETKFPKTSLTYQAERMGLDTTEKILEKFDWFCYFYYHKIDEILEKKGMTTNDEVSKKMVSKNTIVIMDSNFTPEILDEEELKKYKKSQLSASVVKLFATVLDLCSVDELLDKRNIIYRVSDILVEKFPETSLDYQTRRMGLETISRIYEKFDWFCYFYPNKVLEVINEKVSDLKLREEIKKELLP